MKRMKPISANPPPTLWTSNLDDRRRLRGLSRQWQTVTDRQSVFSPSRQVNQGNEVVKIRLTWTFEVCEADNDA
jgi:hypothetical protein